MPDKYWKAIERRVARMFDTERIGSTGWQSPDWENEWTVGEVVCHEIPKWILAELAQAERCETDRPKLRLLVIHEKGEPLEEALVVVRLKQFLKLKQEAWEDASGGGNDGTKPNETKRAASGRDSTQNRTRRLSSELGATAPMEPRW